MQLSFFRFESLQICPNVELLLLLLASRQLALALQFLCIEVNIV